MLEVSPDFRSTTLPECNRLLVGSMTSGRQLEFGEFFGRGQNSAREERQPDEAVDLDD
jgi:hypothetical protein